jgi:hypothetical protein
LKSRLAVKGIQCRSRFSGIVSTAVSDISRK